MFYLPTPGCREETSSPAVRMRSINVFKKANRSITKFYPKQHVLATIWSQLNNFQRKTSTRFHKSVKHCKILRCWELKQVPTTENSSAFKEKLLCLQLSEDFLNQI